MRSIWVSWISLRLALVPVEGHLAPTERLQDPDALGPLLDGGGEVAGLVLDAADDRLVAALEAVAEHQHRHGGGEREEGERHVQREQHAEDGGHLHEDQHEEHRAEADEPADDAEVGHGPGQQLAGLPAVVEPDVEALELRVEVVAEAGLEAGGHEGEQTRRLKARNTSISARPAARAAQRATPAAVAVGERSVDHRLDDQRDRDHARRSR